MGWTTGASWQKNMESGVSSSRHLIFTVFPTPSSYWKDRNSWGCMQEQHKINKTIRITISLRIVITKTTTGIMSTLSQTWSNARNIFRSGLRIIALSILLPGVRRRLSCWAQNWPQDFGADLVLHQKRRIDSNGLKPSKSAKTTTNNNTFCFEGNLEVKMFYPLLKAFNSISLFLWNIDSTPQVWRLSRWGEDLVQASSSRGDALHLCALVGWFEQSTSRNDNNRIPPPPPPPHHHHHHHHHQPRPSSPTSKYYHQNGRH